MIFLPILALLLSGALLSAWVERAHPIIADQLFGWIPASAMGWAALVLAGIGAGVLVLEVAL